MPAVRRKDGFGWVNMERIFCKDKKDFCDVVEDCTKCQYAKGNGVIAGYAAHDLLCTLFGADYDLDRLRELVEADKAGRCVVLPDGECSNKDGENALKSAMNTVFYHNNPVTQYIAYAVAEKLTREEAEAALEKMKEAQA